MSRVRPSVRNAFSQKLFITFSETLHLYTNIPSAFWSLNEVVGDLRIHVRLYVRTCVRHAVARKRFITFF